MAKSDFKEYCDGCDAPLCANCGCCLCRDCSAVRHVIIVYGDPLPHELTGESIPLWVCDECRPFVERELQTLLRRD